jgi:uncharacterized protein (TIGR02452 family)
MYPSRSKAAAIAKSTLQILASGRYTNRAGRTIQIEPQVGDATKGTVSYPPDATLPSYTSTGRQTIFEVLNTTTLEAARKLVAEGYAPVALNFASARHPGGGFLGGARAQEESLCRSSALYQCINNDQMYRYHASVSGGFYSNYAIYSPRVPVIKDDVGELLDEPYLCGFVTAPAVNAGVIADRNRTSIHEEMHKRIDKVLTIMAGHGHDAAILGAWGCGVFKNDPVAIAELFAQALHGPFAGAFAKVIFAVLSKDGEAINPFAERFGGVSA